MDTCLLSVGSMGGVCEAGGRLWLWVFGTFDGPRLKEGKHLLAWFVSLRLGGMGWCGVGHGGWENPHVWTRSFSFPFHFIPFHFQWKKALCSLYFPDWMAAWPMWYKSVE